MTLQWFVFMLGLFYVLGHILPDFIIGLIERMRKKS